MCLAYLNDIIVHSKDLSTRMDIFRLMFDRLLATGLKLEGSKCRLLRTKAGFLRHRISAQGLDTDPAMVEAVWKWPTPRCLKDVRSFLGICSYYRKFPQGICSHSCPVASPKEKRIDPFAWDPVSGRLRYA